jgi:Type II secretion system (T2SS), protein E, N-terminal domain
MDSIPLPLIDLPEPGPALEWARLPFAPGPAIAPLPDHSLRCRIETLSGAAMNGELVAFDTVRGELGIRSGPDAPVLALPLARFRRLTLTVPLALPRPAPGAVQERERDDTQPRDYRVELAGGAGFIDGHTIGRARHAAGWFFFSPTDIAGQVLRQFVPAAAALRVSFGATEAERARQHWIERPQELLAALAARVGSATKPLGEALIELGLTRRGDVEQVLVAQGSDPAQALGQMLIERGLIDQQDLQIALAHKMGVPLVDVARFPIDAALLAGLPQALLRECRALPLLQDGRRLVVAVDDLARLGRLAADPSMAPYQLLPALAPRALLEPLLRRHLDPEANDPWAANLGR